MNRRLAISNLFVICSVLLSGCKDKLELNQEICSDYQVWPPEWRNHSLNDGSFPSFIQEVWPPPDSSIGYYEYNCHLKPYLPENYMMEIKWAGVGLDYQPMRLENPPPPSGTNYGSNIALYLNGNLVPKDQIFSSFFVGFPYLYETSDGSEYFYDGGTISSEWGIQLEPGNYYALIEIFTFDGDQINIGWHFTILPPN